jgi:hypothetical protein
VETTNALTNPQAIWDALCNATDRFYAAKNTETRRLAEIEAFRLRDRLTAVVGDGSQAWYTCGGRERCSRCGLPMPKRGRNGGRCQCNPIVPTDPEFPATGKSRRILKGLGLFALALFSGQVLTLDTL